MFDGSLPEIGELAALEDAAVVEAAGGWARVEAAACARKQAALAESFARRTGLGADERELWWVDPDAAVTAELAAALNVSPGMALAQTHRGVALRDRLPTVAALFAAGLISDVLVRAIVWRTHLITDPAAMAAVDAALAEQVLSWGPLSVKKTEQAIDALVDQHDPGALRRSRAASQYRGVEFGSPSDEAGFTSLWARLYAPDAAVLQRRVEEIARSVCEADPRTRAERRADALTALATGQTDLACDCGGGDCPAAGRDGVVKNAIVHVVADAATVAAAREQTPDPAPPTPAAAPPTPAAAPAGPPANNPRTEATVTAAREQTPDPSAPTPAAPQAGPPGDTAGTEAKKCSAPPAFVMGGGVMPAPLLAAVLERATVREVRHPGDAPPEPRYVPSRELSEFVRCRDLTCRWPGCDKPADGCDLDHTVPYPVGPTHASNLKCLCRFHHLLKTFWCGVCGWRDRQLPDGTIIWTSPTGHTYTTRPGSALLFPTLCLPTGELWAPGHEPPATTPTGDRGAMMPKRRHTRAHNRQRSIAAERRLNDALVAERNRPPPF